MEEPGAGFSRLTESVIGAAIEVHRLLGPGYVESVYEEALAIELSDRRVEFIRQPTVRLAYKGRRVGESRLDLIVERRLVVELKAIDRLTPVHEAQVISYLRMTGFRLGLLLNFNERTLIRGVRRIVNTVDRAMTSDVTIDLLSATPLTRPSSSDQPPSLDQAPSREQPPSLPSAASAPLRPLRFHE